MAFTFKVPLARKTLTGRETLFFCAKNKLALSHDLVGAILYADIIEGCKEEIPILHGLCYPTFDTFLSNDDWYLGAIEDLGYLDIVEEYKSINKKVYELVKKEYADENDDDLIMKIIALLPQRYLDLIKKREEFERECKPELKETDTEEFKVEDVIDMNLLDSLFPKDSDNEIIKRGYAIEEDLSKNNILFLGLNPSYDTNKPDAQAESSHFYPNNLQKMKEKGLELHKHFLREKKLYDDLVSYGLLYKNNIFPHHDLLCMREQKSGLVLDLCKKNTDFFEKQISLSKQVIEAASPVLIVAENSELRRFFFENEKKKVFAHAYWDPQLGVDFFFVGDKPTPILFTGMISALNNGSYYTLRWHMQHILEQIR